MLKAAKSENSFNTFRLLSFQKPTAVHPTTPNPESRPEATKSGGSVLDSQPRERKSSRSSSKDSDGKESEIVADVLKSLMSLNQMSESSAGSPDKSKV